MSKIKSIADYHSVQSQYCHDQAMKETDSETINHWLAGARLHAQKASDLTPSDVEPK